MTLNAATIIQGDRYDIDLALTNLADLVAGHPLKANGLQTTGWSLRLVAKPNKALADGNSSVINLGSSRFTVSSATAATYAILPSDTRDIVLSSNSVTYSYDVQIAEDADADNYVFTMERGIFTLSKDTAITAP